MAITMSSMHRVASQLEILKEYELFIKDAICDELHMCAKMLNLKCLSFMHCAEDCVFNESQRIEILNTEIPLMRAQNLSSNAQQALKEFENVLKDISDPYALLVLQGE